MPVYIVRVLRTERRLVISVLGRWDDSRPGTDRGARVAGRQGCASPGNTCEFGAGKGSEGFAANNQFGEVGFLHQETITQTSHSAIVISSDLTRYTVSERGSIHEHDSL